MAEEGQLSFGISIDDSALKNEALNVEKAFADIAAKAKAAGVSMDESLSLKGGSNDAIKALNNLKATYNQLSADIKNSDVGKALKQSLAQGVVAADNFAEAVKKAGDQSNSNGIPETASRFNGLNASIQQVVRELPSASMGMNMFFLAISNNLPIVADQIKAINAANKEAAAQGKATSSVLSMIGKSLMGWQTLMMVGITLLTMYSGKIIEWVSSLFKGKDALAATRQAQVQFNDDMKKASDTYTQTLSSNAAQNISKYQSLSDSYKRLGSNINAQKKFIDANQEAFRELGLSIHDVRAANQALISDKAKMIDYFMTTARAAAYQATMVQLMQKQIGLKIKQYNAPNKMDYRDMKAAGVTPTSGQYEQYLKAISAKNVYWAGSANATVKLTPEQQKQYVAHRADWKADQIEAQKLNKQIQDLGNSAANTNMKLDKLKGSLSYVNSGSGESKSGKTRRSTPTAKDYASTINSRAKALAEAYKDLQDKSVEEEEKAQDAITAASLSAMKEGTQKEIAQIKQDAKNKQDEIDKSVRDLATKLANTSMKEYLAKSPQNTYKGWLKTDQGQMNISDWENTITGNGDISGFTKQMQAAILKYRQSINRQIVANQTETSIKLDKIRQDAINSMNEYLSEYGSYQEKRLSLTELYNDKIANAANEGEKKILQAQLNEKLQDLDFSEFKKSIDWEDVFGNLDILSYSALERLKEKLVTYINKASGEIKPSDLKALTEAISKIEMAQINVDPFKALGKAFNELKSANEEVNKAQEDLNTILKGGAVETGIYTDETGKLTRATLSQSEAEKKLEEAIKKRGNAQNRASKSIDSIMGGINTFANYFKGLSDNLGNDSLSNDISTFTDTLNSLYSGFKQMKGMFSQGGIFGKIGGGQFGNAAGIIAIWAQLAVKTWATIKRVTEEERQKWLDLSKRNMQIQHQYELVLLQQDLLNKKATTIFGTDAYKKAINAVDNYRESLEKLHNTLSTPLNEYGSPEYRSMRGTNNGRGDTGLSDDALQNIYKDISSFQYASKELKQMYAGLANIQVVSGTKTSGWWLWKKVKDTYSSILEVYPQLIDNQGKFNLEYAEQVANAAKMSDGYKAQFQAIIDYAKQAEEAWKSVTDWLTDIFGTLGNDITNILKDSFMNGTDAAQKMCDSVSSMLETLAQQMVYSFAFQKIFSDAQKQIEEIMKNENLDDKGRFTSFTDVFKSMSDQMIAAVPEAKELMEWMKQYGEAKGLDLFTNKATSQNTTSKGFATASQDSIDELNGRFTAIQMNSETVKESIQAMQDDFKVVRLTVQANRVDIAEMRNLALMSVGHLEAISKNTHELYSMNEKLDKIERNTRAL